MGLNVSQKQNTQIQMIKGSRSSDAEYIFSYICLRFLPHISSFVHNQTNKYLYIHKERCDIPHHRNWNEQQNTVERKLILVPMLLYNEIYKVVMNHRFIES